MMDPPFVHNHYFITLPIHLLIMEHCKPVTRPFDLCHNILQFVEALNQSKVKRINDLANKVLITFYIQIKQVYSLCTLLIRSNHI